MPRNAESERHKAIQRVEQYLAPIFASSDDGRSLSASAIARAMNISRSTIAKYGLNHRIQEALTFRRKQQRSTPRVAAIEDRLKRAIEERDEWKRRYLQLCEVHTRLEFHLRQHPTIDLDRLLATPMPKPLRLVPGLSKRRSLRD